jgi:hypothetical protein
MSPNVVEGRLVSPTQIELVHPVHCSEPAVEIEIRPRQATRHAALLALLDRMARRPARGRTWEDIRQQTEEERESWEHRR